MVKRSKKKILIKEVFTSRIILETNKRNKTLKRSNYLQDRIYILFFFFFSLILIFSIKITHISLNKKNIFNIEKQNSQFSLIRRDVVDRNGVLISRNVKHFSCRNRTQNY